VNAAAPVCAPPQSPGRRPRLTLPAGSCDAHVHVIGPTDSYALDARRNYTPVVCSLAEYRDVMAACGIERAVLVQPSVYGTDNRQLLDALREGGDAFRGVVVPAAEVSDAELDAMHGLGVRGIRLNLVNPQVVGLDEVVALCARVAGRGWHLQVQIRWGDAAQATLASVAAKVSLPLVVDHMGRPPSMQAPRALLDLLGSGRGWVKLSAPYRLSAGEAPPCADVLPLVHALVNANPDQLLWASDWPHTERFTPTPHDADLVDLLPEWLGNDDLIQRVCVTNPARLYGY
jgi:predicted TIM-barrel fold metal-dependent hydrolase